MQGLKIHRTKCHVTETVVECELFEKLFQDISELSSHKLSEHANILEEEHNMEVEETGTEIAEDIFMSLESVFTLTNKTAQTPH